MLGRKEMPCVGMKYVAAMPVGHDRSLGGAGTPGAYEDVTAGAGDVDESPKKGPPSRL